MIPVSDLLDLSGKVALVTGAGHGLGRAIAHKLRAAGALCAVLDQDADRAADTVSELGGGAVALVADVTRSSEVEAATSRCVAELGGLDILVNNVGIYPHGQLLDISDEEWDRVLAVNLKSVFVCTRAAGRVMIERASGGRVVNIASIDAVVPERHFAHYDASKGGVVALTRSLAVELGPHRINVNAVGPGLIDTTLLDVNVPLRKRAFLEHVPLGSIGSADDQANAVLFLCGAASRWMTGQTLYVDGGVMLSGYMTGVDE